MLAKCIEINAENLSEGHFEVGYTTDSQINLKLGNQYSVYGVSVWRGLTNYLMMGEEELPAWYSSELFELIDNSLPGNWSLLIAPTSYVQLIVGYEEMINSFDNHYDAILERDEDALKIFFMRKGEIDKETGREVV